MNLVIELPAGQDVYRVASELSLATDEGDRLTVIQSPRHWWQRTRVTSWSPDKVVTTNGIYSFARLEHVSAAHSRRGALHG